MDEYARIPARDAVTDDAREFRQLMASVFAEQALRDHVQEYEDMLQEQMRHHLGSPTEQYERVEALIDALDTRHATGIDRTAVGWWKTTSRP